MKFYELEPKERRALLAASARLKLLPIASETLQRLNQLSENVMGSLTLPMGVVPRLIVNGATFIVPMVTEESSVVAAANHGSQIFNQNGGVKAVAHRQGIWGQIVVRIQADFEGQAFESYCAKLITVANQTFVHLRKHGGGVRQILWQRQTDLLVLKVLLDPAQAMGANRMNDVLAFLADQLQQYPKVTESLFAIVSNYPSQLETVEIALSYETLVQSGDRMSGQKTAKKIVLLSQFGQNEPYRGVTNNKGIMNGVDSVLMATGNDTRAVEAAVGVWASRKGRYDSLSRWFIANDRLCGKLTLPFPLGVVGGSIHTRPEVQQAYQLLSHRPITARQLAGIIAAIGLANNFAALNAIATDGIQSGHMKLQARNLVAALKASESEKQAVLLKMIASQKYSRQTALDYLALIRQEKV